MRTDALRLVLAGLAFAAAQSAAFAQAQPNVNPPRAKLTDFVNLMSDASPSKARPTDCQPRKGEAITILDTRTQIDGIAGVNAVQVIVLEGACKGVQGWIGPKNYE